MASFNNAEKRYPNAVEGIMAGRSLAFEGQRTIEHLDFLEFEEDEGLFPNSLFSDFDEGIFRPASPIRNNIHNNRTDSRLLWLDSFRHGREVGNDNAAVTNHGIETFKQKASAYASIGEEIARELSRLPKGWAGEDTVSPSASVLFDLLRVTALLPSETIEPDTEVDPDDGSVVLRWTRSEITSTFTLTFLGKGEVGGFLSSPQQLPAWKIKISDTSQIAGKIMSEGVLNVITD